LSVQGRNASNVSRTGNIIAIGVRWGVNFPNGKVYGAASFGPIADLQHQGAGLGKGLRKDTLLRSAQAADIAGIRALLVHAKDETARQWCLNWEFEPGPSDSLHLFFLMKDFKAMVLGA